MICFGNVPAGSVLPVMFGTYGKTNGESITLTGLAVTDIEVYKGTSMTQRASDAGYTLLDTDGIDIDSITGIHGFSIDTGDNTDAGFYTAGSFYTVVVSAVTVDSQTVNFVAATFRLTVADNTSGTPVVDVGRISNDATAADNCELFFDGTGYAGTNNVIPTVTTLTGHTAQTGDAYAIVNSGTHGNAALKSLIDTILGDTGTDIPALIAALNDLSAAEVNAEVVDALATDTRAEPGQGAPGATIALALKIDYLYKWARNKKDNDGSTTKFYADDGSTVDQKQTTSESGGTVTVGEIASGP